MDASSLLARILEADREYRAAMKEAQAHGGAVVYAARKELGMTQRELADKLGVHFTYISKLEKSVAPVSRPVLGKLARLLGGVSVEDRPGPVVATS